MRQCVSRYHYLFVETNTVILQVLAFEARDANTVRRLHRDFGTEPQSASYQLAVLVELLPLLTLQGVKSEGQRKALLEGTKASFTGALSRLAFVAQKTRDAGLKGWCEQAQIVFGVLSGSGLPPKKANNIPVVNQPSVSNEGSKYTIQFYNKPTEPVIVSPEGDQATIKVFDCRDAVIQINTAKLTAIIVDKCERVGLMLSGDVIGAVEVVNSRQAKVQVQGILPNMVIEACEGVTMYLSVLSGGVKIVSSRSSELNVIRPGRFTSASDSDSSDSSGCTCEGEDHDGNDQGDEPCPEHHQDSASEDSDIDQVEVAIPVQFVSYFDQDRLVTEPVQHSGN